MELNRNALIAYMYDVYCVEQALDEINREIAFLNDKRNQLSYEEENEVVKKKDEINEEIYKTKNSYVEKKTNPEVQLDEKGITVFIAVDFAVFLIIAIVYVTLINRSDRSMMTMLIAFLLFLFLLGSVSFMEKKHILSLRKKETAKENETNQKSIEHRLDVLNRAIEITSRKIHNKFELERFQIDKQVEELTIQKRKFEELRYDLYHDLLLIPYPHQNLLSVCYIYRYLLTSRVTDLNYIYTQLNLEKIINQIREIASVQKEILLIQRKTLAELQTQTSILSNINHNLLNFESMVDEKMRQIHDDLTEITDNQREILNNQATMYNTYINNALNSASTEEEKLAYAKMIENNTRVNAMFTRADFLSLKFDRNWSGDY